MVVGFLRKGFINAYLSYYTTKEQNLSGSVYTMPKEINIPFWRNLLLSFMLTMLPVLVYAAEHLGGFDWGTHGILPRNISGLQGILFSPFLHADLMHLLSNSVPLFALLWLLGSHFRDIFWPVLIFIWAASGLWTWFIARDAYVIGSSGVVYGLAAFAITAGFVSKNRQAQGIGLFTLFFYGSMIWGVFPIEMNLNRNISWEGHACGAAAGVISALVMKPAMPERPRYSWELEPETADTEEDDYWKLPEQRETTPDPGNSAPDNESNETSA